MKRVVRDQLDELSTELFGVKSFWNTFKQKRKLDDETILGLFMALRKRLPKFNEFRQDLERMLLAGDKVYIHRESAILGIPTTKMVGNVLEHGMEYPEVFEIKFMPIPKDGHNGFFLKVVSIIKRDDKTLTTTQINADSSLVATQDTVD